MEGWFRVVLNPRAKPRNLLPRGTKTGGKSGSAGEGSLGRSCLPPSFSGTRPSEPPPGCAHLASAAPAPVTRTPRAPPRDRACGRESPGHPEGPGTGSEPDKAAGARPGPGSGRGLRRETGARSCARRGAQPAPAPGPPALLGLRADRPPLHPRPPVLGLLEGAREPFCGPRRPGCQQSPRVPPRRPTRRRKRRWEPGPSGRRAPRAPEQPPFPGPAPGGRRGRGARSGGRSGPGTPQTGSPPARGVALQPDAASGLRSTALGRLRGARFPRTGGSASGRLADRRRQRRRAGTSGRGAPPAKVGPAAQPGDFAGRWSRARGLGLTWRGGGQARRGGGQGAGGVRDGGQRQRGAESGVPGSPGSMLGGAGAATRGRRGAGSGERGARPRSETRSF